MEREILVNLDYCSEAQKFCRLAEDSRAEIKLYSDGYIVNGKSLLGMFSLDLSKPVTVRISGDPNDVEDFISKVIKNVNKNLKKG